MKTLEISKVFELKEKSKYEIACATFDVVDHIFKVDVPKGIKNRKLAVQALSLLANNELKYDYDTTSDATPAISDSEE